MNGKFIVIYGANNLGKTTQITMLQAYLQQQKKVVQQVKYPRYELEPTGPIINAVLREGKQMPEAELQQLYVQNRLDFQPQLKSWLSDGAWVLAEDYVGTGIAWGIVRGVPLAFLEEINAPLYPADLAILLEGERFPTGRESHNRNEADDEIWHKAQANHHTLGQKYGWNTVQANQPREKVQADIIKVLEEKGMFL